MLLYYRKVPKNKLQTDLSEVWNALENSCFNQMYLGKAAHVFFPDKDNNVATKHTGENVLTITIVFDFANINMIIFLEKRSLRIKKKRQPSAEK